MLARVKDANEEGTTVDVDMAMEEGSLLDGSLADI